MRVLPSLAVALLVAGCATTGQDPPERADEGSPAGEDAIPLLAEELADERAPRERLFGPRKSREMPDDEADNSAPVEKRVDVDEKRLSQAYTHFELGDYDLAIEQLDHIRSGSPQFAEAERLRSRIR